jgi:hypothetical protein
LPFVLVLLESPPGASTSSSPCKLQRLLRLALITLASLFPQTAYIFASQYTIVNKQLARAINPGTHPAQIGGLTTLPYRDNLATLSLSKIPKSGNE